MPNHPPIHFVLDSKDPFAQKRIAWFEGHEDITVEVAVACYTPAYLRDVERALKERHADAKQTENAPAA